jgi:hypothetical protein
MHQIVRSCAAKKIMPDAIHWHNSTVYDAHSDFVLKKRCSKMPGDLKISGILEVGFSGSPAFIMKEA